MIQVLKDFCSNYSFPEMNFSESQVYKAHLHGWKHPSVVVLKCFRKLAETGTGLCASFQLFWFAAICKHQSVCALYTEGTLS